MSIQFNIKNKDIHIVLNGKFTLSNSDKLLLRLTENIAPQTRYILDLKEVNFMDSAGLGAIVAFYKNLKKVNSQLIVKSLNEELKILFEITRATKFFTIVESEQDIELRQTI